jgi:hypothetical protein
MPFAPRSGFPNGKPAPSCKRLTISLLWLIPCVISVGEFYEKAAGGQVIFT